MALQHAVAGKCLWRVERSGFSKPDHGCKVGRCVFSDVKYPLAVDAFVRIGLYIGRSLFSPFYNLFFAVLCRPFASPSRDSSGLSVTPCVTPFVFLVILDKAPSSLSVRIRYGFKKSRTLHTLYRNSQLSRMLDRNSDIDIYHTERDRRRFLLFWSFFAFFHLLAFWYMYGERRTVGEKRRILDWGGLIYMWVCVIHTLRSEKKMKANIHTNHTRIRRRGRTCAQDDFVLLSASWLALGLLSDFVLCVVCCVVWGPRFL